MRTIETTLYKYSELSERAKEYVKNHWDYDDFCGYDRRASGKAAQEIYKRIERVVGENDLSGVRLYKWITNNILPELTAVKLYYKNTGKFKNTGSYYSMGRYKNNPKNRERYSRIFTNVDACNLTGYCADYSFLGPLFDFLKNPIGDLSNVDVNEICSQEYESDYEGFYEESNFADHMEAHEYEFTEDGKLS